MQASRSSQPQYAGTGPNTKVAIPRLDRRDYDQNLASSDKHRAIKACTNCRKKKVKCTGEVPRCKNCEAIDAPCKYELARKDRLKMATEQNHLLISLLKDLSLRASEDDKKRIDDTIESVEDDDVNIVTASISVKASGKRLRTESPSEEDVSATQVLGEAHVPASVGSNEDTDLLDEDLLKSRESRETGFVGQNSEVQWLRSLQRQMGSAETEHCELPYGPPGSSDEAVTQRINAMHQRRKSAKLGKVQHVADSSFYLDSDSLEVETMLDPYELPPPEIAERLFGCYMETVHGWFPIISEVFEEQFLRYMDALKRHRRFHVPERWQAVLNLVFAIGAHYSHLINVDWRGDSRDHLLYMTRAVRILGVKDTTVIISAPELGLIQATGLLSFYYLGIGHVSRAWIMIGISLRFALAVGLHLRNEDPSASPNRKEELVRIWWSLHSVECLLCSMTGRPCIIDNQDCTVPLPQVLPEESAKRRSTPRRRSYLVHDYATSYGTSPPTISPTSESFSRIEGRAVAGPFLDAHIKIGLTTRKVLKKLYSARTASASWEHIQSLITTLIAELDGWATTAFPNGSGSPNLDLHCNSNRGSLLLGFHYHSIKILITRPCLCRLERRIQGQSDSSSDFNQRMAKICVQAAQNLTLLLPDQPDPTHIYQKGPWWSIIHIIMQAMAVFLLEMHYRGTHMTTRDNEEIPKCIKKLLRWLGAMRRNNAVAERAYKLVLDILKSGESRIQVDITNLLAEDEADIEGGNSFQAFPGVIDPSDPGDAFATGQWQPDFYDPPGFAPMSDTYLWPDQFPMSSMYGNPFLTNFDQGNPISLTMDEIWRNTDDASSEYPPSHQQQPLQ